MNLLHQLNLDTIGGVEKLFNAYCELSTLHHSLLVNNKRIHPVLKPGIAGHVKNIAYVKYAGPVKLPGAWRRMNVRRVLSRFKPDKIVYWNHCPRDSRVLLEYKVPYIYYDHGLAWLKSEDTEYVRFLQHAEHLIACGESAKRMLQLRQRITKPISVVPNCFCAGAVQGIIKSKKLDPNGPITLGFAGRLVSFKGAPLAVHALFLLRKARVDASLHIAGDGPHKEQLIHLIKRLNLTRHVRFLGVVPDIRLFYQVIDFFLAPSLRDPYPLVAIEALCFGCVPIATAVDGFTDIIESEKTGVCIPASLPLKDYVSLGGDLQGIPEYVYNPAGDCLASPQLIDPQAIAQRIQKFLTQPEDYQRMSALGVSARDSRFAIKHYVAALDAVFRKNTR